MNRRISRLFFILLLAACCGRPALWAQTALPEFSSRDRVLILAPHPDDEAIATGGVIQRAVKAGSSVKVVCYTNGDNNEFSFIVYEKRLTFRKGIFLHMGAVRARETMEAMKFLGIKEHDVDYMGYPDFGTMEILTKYWDTARPYRSWLPRVRKVPYQDALSIGAPYVGESILSDLKTIIMAYKPTRIFVSHPADTNRDHQSLYLFLSVALWDLAGRIEKPQVYPYLLHMIGWPRPRGRHPKLALKPPKSLANLSWYQLSLTQEELSNKQKAIGFYKSQISYNPPYLYTFARVNELFGDFDPVIIPRSADDSSIRWQAVGEGNGPQGNGSFLQYAVVGNDLRIKVALRKKIDKRIGLYIHLLGYNRNKDFSRMPKLAITVGWRGMRIKNKKDVVFIKGAKLAFEGTNAHISIPLASLGDPDYIMARGRRRFFRVPLDAASWRILEVR
ncbi:MAG TPA: PIG-L family deacetylase [Candidatus Omnitrophota bacterium]|nr:PIG-L family deacetylase [Candidatus Omnitrophota bacterium]HQQ06522.1 PIG-L family deacetylase [Candidatus Omnitrophota bacterium]